MGFTQTDVTLKQFMMCQYMNQHINGWESQQNLLRKFCSLSSRNGGKECVAWRPKYSCKEHYYLQYVATMKAIFAYNNSELVTINNKTPVPESIYTSWKSFFSLPMKRYFRWNLLKVNAIFLSKNRRYQLASYPPIQRR